MEDDGGCLKLSIAFLISRGEYLISCSIIFHAQKQVAIIVHNNIITPNVNNGFFNITTTIIYDNNNAVFKYVCRYYGNFWRC